MLPLPATRNFPIWVKQFEQTERLQTTAAVHSHSERGGEGGGRAPPAGSHDSPTDGLLAP